MRKTHFYISLIALSCCFLHSATAQNKSIILGRPTDTSITVSVFFDQNMQYYIEYGTRSGSYSKTTSTYTNKANTPDKIDLRGLTANTQYFYRVQYRLVGASSYTVTPEYRFRTQRAQGTTFSFIVEADEHLYDKKGVRSLYQIALANEAKDSADFMLSLGDTFGDDHTPDLTTSADMDALHKDYLQYLGQVCHSMPFYFCLGNHEGETGYYLKQNPPNNIAVYGTLWRKFYYANPYPNGFYSGNMTTEGYGMGQPENYYAWTWGDALFVVLDVYRDCSVNDKPQNWDWTLGKTQYDWFKKALETSKAKHKFVFAHHTRGQGRGGVVTAKGCEWGGYSGTANTNYQFDTYRPGWGKPIHQLMVDNGVKIFFQGHDHLYAKEQLDGVVYQEVPMPSDSTYKIGVTDNGDAYTDVILDGSGHLKVTVSPSCVKVDFVRAYLPKDTLGTHKNREIAYSYTVGTCSSTATDDISSKNSFFIYPNPAKEVLTVQAPISTPYNRRIDLVNLQGQVVQNQVLEQENTACQFDLKNITAGIYFVRWQDENRVHTQKVAVMK